MRFTSIPEQRRSPQIPRVAKIRLGVKQTAGSGKQYPKEVDYFVCTDCPEVEAALKCRPGELREIPILFPVENIDQIIPHRFAYWGSDAGLKCQGDGRTCMRAVKDEKGEVVMEEGACPGPAECDFALTKGDGSRVAKPLCIRQGTLSFMIPQVSMGGVYQIDTTSYHAIQGIIDDLIYIKSICGRVSLLTIGNRPLLKLVRVPVQTHGHGKKEVHFPVRIRYIGTADDTWMIRKKAIASALPGGQTSAIVKAGENIPDPSAPEDLYPADHFQEQPRTQAPPKTVKSVTTSAPTVRTEPEPTPEPEPQDFDDNGYSDPDPEPIDHVEPEPPIEPPARQPARTETRKVATTQTGGRSLADF